MIQNLTTNTIAQKLYRNNFWKSFEHWIKLWEIFSFWLESRMKIIFPETWTIKMKERLYEKEIDVKGRRSKSTTVCMWGKKNWSYFAFFPSSLACSLHLKTRPSNILRAVYMHMCARWVWEGEREGKIHPSLPPSCLWESKLELIVECYKQRVKEKCKN